MAVVAVALLPSACGGHLGEKSNDADAEGPDGAGQDDGNVVDGDTGDGASAAREASLGDRGDASDASNDAWDAQADVVDAPGDVIDASQCVDNDPPTPVIPANATIAFNVTNTASADRFVLTQATECEAYSIEGKVTLIPYQCGCNCGTVPPEQLYFTRLTPGSSTTLTWDARALSMYDTYVNCRPEWPYCSSITHGSPQPVPAASYVIDVVSAVSVPSGAGTNCTLVNGGDVSCTILAPILLGGLCAPTNIGVETSTVRQSFMAAPGTATVQVEVP